MAAGVENGRRLRLPGATRPWWPQYTEGGSTASGRTPRCCALRPVTAVSNRRWSISPRAIATEPNRPGEHAGPVRVVFAVDDIADVVTRPRAALAGEPVRFGDVYRLCHGRGCWALSYGWPDSPAEGPHGPGSGVLEAMCPGSTGGAGRVPGFR